MAALLSQIWAQHFALPALRVKKRTILHLLAKPRRFTFSPLIPIRSPVPYLRFRLGTFDVLEPAT